MRLPRSSSRGRSERASHDSTKASSSVTLKQLASELSTALVPLIGARRVLENFGEEKVLVDATNKFLIRDDAGKTEFVVLCSAAGGPGIVARGVQRARETVDVLGEALGRVVLLPVAEGNLDGRTFAIYPYCTPLLESGLGGWLQGSIVRPRVARWLVEASRRTVLEVPEDELERRVCSPLEKLTADDGHSPALSELADEALRATRAGSWQPRYVFMHGDLWVGNVLINQRSAGGSRFGRFVIIDWAGSRLRGCPMYDFLRLAISFRWEGRAFVRALDQYCAALGYTRTEGGYAFASAAAELGQSREQWPRSSYLTTIDCCYRKLKSAG